jgi:hypothetical protein
MPRYFTLDQARASLASVGDNLRTAVRLKQEHQRAESELEAIHNKVAMMGGMLLNREKFLGHRARLDATAMRLKEILEELDGLGVQIKDLDIGLIDFPTLYHGEEVLLCWKLGEKDIEFWHSLTDGYRGRRPIDDEFLQNHRGGLTD